MLYPINEIFYSIQGEGYHTGKPAIFIRLAGCNLKCPWCDTDHINKMELTEEQIVETVMEMADNASPVFSPIVVITGGEPSIHDLTDLLKKFESNQCMLSIHIETNGTGKYVNKFIDFKTDCLIDWVTLSPKPEHKPSNEILLEANEIKVVLDGTVDPEDYIDNNYICFLKNDMYGRYFIQPCSEDFQPAVDYVLAHPWWRLSVQIQKVIKIL